MYKMPVPRAVGEVRYPSSKLGDTLREGVDAGVGLEGVEASGLGERTDETSEVGDPLDSLVLPELVSHPHFPS